MGSIYEQPLLQEQLTKDALFAKFVSQRVGDSFGIQVFSYDSSIPLSYFSFYLWLQPSEPCGHE